MSKTCKTNAGQTRAKSCTGKSAFTTAAQARTVMLAVRRKRDALGWMDVYKCKYCGLFHYGHARGVHDSRSFRMVKSIDRALAADALLQEKRAGSA